MDKHKELIEKMADRIRPENLSRTNEDIAKQMLSVILSDVSQVSKPCVCLHIEDGNLVAVQECFRCHGTGVVAKG